jgi:DNA-binding FadR family transcriptional regulator
MHIVAEHRAIYEAVAHAEPDAARGAMRTHFENGRRWMLGSSGQVWR